MSKINETPLPIQRLLEIMARLRAPGGCPWDREQTHASIKQSLIEECYEVLEAIDAQNFSDLKEELGDVLLQVVFHAQLASEEKQFNFDDVATAIADKLVRRHPHVFGDLHAPDSETVMTNWNAIKKMEKPERHGIFEGVPPALPALMRAEAIQRKAAHVGFDWPDSAGPLAKVHEEIEELEAELNHPEKAREELGDLLFAIVNVSRKLKIDPEQALAEATKKFQNRFEQVKLRIEATGKKMEESSLEEMDRIWDEVKKW